jgi:hypothetical protein
MAVGRSFSPAAPDSPRRRRQCRPGEPALDQPSPRHDFETRIGVDPADHSDEEVLEGGELASARTKIRQARLVSAFRTRACERSPIA